MISTIPERPKIRPWFHPIGSRVAPAAIFGGPVRLLYTTAPVFLDE
jgi:hypothetical protein